MRKIPQSLKQEILKDPYYGICARRNDGSCSDTITWEHSIIHLGKQLNEKWAIIPLCTYHHAVNEHQDGKGLDKRKNEWIALHRANDEQLTAISKAKDWKHYRNYLDTIYE